MFIKSHKQTVGHLCHSPAPDAPRVPPAQNVNVTPAALQWPGTIEMNWLLRAGISSPSSHYVTPNYANESGARAKERETSTAWRHSHLQGHRAAEHLDDSKQVWKGAKKHTDTHTQTHRTPSLSHTHISTHREAGHTLCDYEDTQRTLKLLLDYLWTKGNATTFTIAALFC